MQASSDLLSPSFFQSIQLERVRKRNTIDPLKPVIYSLREQRAELISIGKIIRSVADDHSNRNFLLRNARSRGQMISGCTIYEELVNRSDTIEHFAKAGEWMKKRRGARYERFLSKCKRERMRKMSLLSPPSISLLLEDTVRKRSRLARVRVHVCVCPRSVAIRLSRSAFNYPANQKFLAFFLQLVAFPRPIFREIEHPPTRSIDSKIDSEGGETR